MLGRRKNKKQGEKRIKVGDKELQLFLSEVLTESSDKFEDIKNNLVEKDVRELADTYLNDHNIGMGLEIDSQACVMVIMDKSEPTPAGGLSHRDIPLMISLKFEDDEWKPLSVGIRGTSVAIPVSDDRMTWQEMPDTLQAALNRCLAQARLALIAKIDRETANA